MGTPPGCAASWQQRVDALGRALYKRNDESTATALGEGAELLHADYRDDLRRLRARAERDPDRIRELLTRFPRLGPVGAQIFCREAQAVWPELRPTLDGKALDGARALDLPTDPERLAAQVRPGALAASCTATRPRPCPAPAWLMLVGEQPGDREDLLAGKLFVGPAGRVLDDALARPGSTRTGCT